MVRIDLDDLICYAASRPLYSGAHGFTSLQNAERAYELSLRHKGFFTQLATHVSRNSYRASYIKWIERLYGELTIRDDMPEDEREFRRLSIAAYASGSIDLYFAWAASGMKAPASTAVRALEGDLARVHARGAGPRAGGAGLLPAVGGGRKCPGA